MCLSIITAHNNYSHGSAEDCIRRQYPNGLIVESSSSNKIWHITLPSGTCYNNSNSQINAPTNALITRIKFCEYTNRVIIDASQGLIIIDYLTGSAELLNDSDKKRKLG